MPGAHDAMNDPESRALSTAPHNARDRSEQSPPRMPLAGKLRGECIHWTCATEEEQSVTWFFYWRTPPAIDCDRCGKPLGEDPNV